MARFFNPPTRLAALLLAVALGLGALFFITPSARKLCCSAVYKTFTSPDQRFQLTVYRLGWPWPMPPGSAGDASGFVRLRTHEGTVLQEQDVQMVQLVDKVVWEPQRVEIKLVADWALPGP